MLILLVIMFVLSALFFGGLFLFVRWLKKNTNSTQLPHEKSDGTLTVRDFFGIEGIERGILHLTDGRYRVYLEGPSLNVPLMSEEEQATLEYRFATLMARINFPVQFYIQNRPLDLNEVMDDLSFNFENVSENLQEYAAEYQYHIANLASEHPIWVRKKIIVISYDDPECTIEEVIKILDYRARLILSELASMDINGWALCTEEIAQVLYSHFNKNKILNQPFRNAIEAGHTQLISRGGFELDGLLQ